MSAVDLLVIGGTGLAGRRIVAAARSRGLSVAVLARGGDLAVDIRDEAALRRALADVEAATIINSAAVVSLPECERDPTAAWMVNARPASIIAGHAQERGARFVQISTDHFYRGDGRRPHRETEPVQLVNEYARSKYAGEAFALTAPRALVLRTNFAGWPSPRGTSFAEWAMGVIETDAAADLYDDQYVSLLDVWTLAESVLDLVEARAEGVMNLGASEIFSKAEFILALARASGRALTKARPAPVASGDVVRADSLGLDVSRAQSILGRALPTLDGVVANLLMHLEERRS